MLLIRILNNSREILIIYIKMFDFQGGSSHKLIHELGKQRNFTRFSLAGI